MESLGKIRSRPIGRARAVMNNSILTTVYSCCETCYTVTYKMKKYVKQKQIITVCQ